MAQPNVNHPPRFDRENAAMEAAALGDLVLWINQARDLIDEIRQHAGHESSTMSMAIERHSIAINNPDWTSMEVGSGFAFVMHRQNHLIKALGQPGSGKE